MALRLWSSKPIRAWLFSVCAIALILVGLGAYFKFFYQPAKTGPQAFDKVVIPADAKLGQFFLQPTKADALGVETDTAFTLKSSIPIQKKDIEVSLSILPKVDLAIASVSDKEFTITPKEKLAAGSVYKISLGTTVKSDTGSEKQIFSWAYQPKESLEIDGTLPKNKATGVPLNTGIEVTFNTDKVKDFEKNITFSPALEGRFEKHGRVVAFVPKERLRPSTLYSVVVAKGLPINGSSVSLASDFIFKFETAGTDDNNGYSYPDFFDPSFHAVKPGEAPVIESNNTIGDLTSSKAVVYKFKDNAELVERLKPLDEIPEWAYWSRKQALIKLEGLHKIGEYTPTVEIHDYQRIIRMPNGFDAGYYVMDLTLNKQRLQTVVAVSEIGAAMYASRQEAVLWVQDLKTKEPLVGGSVKNLESSEEKIIDKDGLAKLKTPSAVTGGNDSLATRSYFSVTAKDGRNLIVPIAQNFYGSWMNYGMGWRSSNPDYWAYVSTDRTLYRPDDTVNVWGVVRDRQATNFTDQEVKMEIWTWNYVDGNSDYIPLVTETVKTGEYGNYIKSIKLDHLTSGSYTLSVKNSNNEIIASKYFEVRTFAKPAYQILVTPDKLAGFDGEEITYSIQTQFFDGTPAPNIKLAYSDYGQAGEAGTKIITDAQGKASVKVTINAKDPKNIQYIHKSFFPQDAAEGDIVADTDVIGYPSAVTFDPTGQFEGNNAKISLTLSTIDTSKVNTTWYYMQDIKGVIVPNSEITGTVYEQITKKTKRGEEYNFIEKTVVDLYDYTTTDEKREDFSGLTNDKGIFEKEFNLTGTQYRIDITAKDQNGRKVTRSVYLYKDGYHEYSQNNDYMVTDAQDLADANGVSKKYNIGETTEIRLIKNGQPVKGKGPFLFIKMQNGIKEVSVKDVSTFKYVFKAEDAPNISFSAAYFNGSSFILTNYSANLVFNEQSRALNLKLEPGQATYAPGDKAKLKVTVTNKQNQPVKTLVNLSAIDEAITAIQIDNTPTPLETLYTFLPDGLIEQYASHLPTKLETMAEGGGGGDGARKNFKDAVLFTEVETNAAGQAEVEFSLPDNITSWRITAQGVTQDLSAGQNSIKLPVTKAIFGVLTMSEEYVVDDQPVVVAGAYGSGLNVDSDISFKLEVPGLGESQTKTAKAFTLQKFVLPKFQVGDQEIILTVKSGEQSDVLSRKFKVLSSRLTKAANEFLEAKPGLTITGSDVDRTTLVFSDLERGRLISSLYGLRWAYGKRLETHLSANIAKDLLTQLGIQGIDSNKDPNFFLSFQQEDGGISQINYGSSSLTLSAYAAGASDVFDKVKLRQYFVNKLEQKNASTEQIGLALLGLANLNEPVLPDIDSFLNLNNLDAEDQLTAALAYYALGSYEKTAGIMVELFKKYGVVEKPFAKLNLGGSNDSKIVNTARFYILAEGLKYEQRAGLSKYLANNFPKDTITNLERVLAIKAAVPLLNDQSVSLDNSVNSQVTSIQLKNSETKTISLTPAELKTFKVVSYQGLVGIAVSSLTPIDINAEKKDDRLSLDRTYFNITDWGKAIKQGDIVRIDLKPKLKGNIIDTTYFVIDELPSGLVLLTNPWQRGIAYDNNQGYPLEIDGQRLTFYSNAQRAFHYYARVLTPGGYAAEPALIQGQNSREIINYSGAQTLEIK
ncbi:MAG: Ig-like domain-containing protein [Patescibacteria group bacterium]